RTVWVPEHCFAEFYLENENGDGFWFPCQPAGDKAFGEMPFQYIILQKGDNFTMPGDRKKYRYLPQQMKTKSKAAPSYQWISEVVTP
ncbi:MAG: transglutaminase domain-containing protein, partial [Thermoguttaceae bacterium]|nr:transglutaminase domain-containing protein [Thermoguttaceae bacterium]